MRTGGHVTQYNLNQLQPKGIIAMNPLLFNHAIEAQLAPFFKKNEIKPEVVKRPFTPNRVGSRPNYYVYNSETQEVIELERQSIQADVRQAFRYLHSLTTPKSLTLWAVIGVLNKTQQIRFRKIYNGGDQFEITPDHPLKLALIKAGYNFEKSKRGGANRVPALPKITLKVLGSDS
jgi:hypothetical protein